MRMCIVTRKKKSKAELARLVLDVESDKIVLDESGKKAGRGVNISPSIKVLEEAFNKGFFKRAFKKDIGEDNKKELFESFKKFIEKREFRRGRKKVSIRINESKVKLK